MDQKGGGGGRSRIKSVKYNFADSRVDERMLLRLLPVGVNWTKRAETSNSQVASIVHGRGPSGCIRLLTDS